MAYTKKTWVKGSTPLSAENFNHMEQGIADAHTEITQLNSERAFLSKVFSASDFRINANGNLKTYLNIFKVGKELVIMGGIDVPFEWFPSYSFLAIEGLIAAKAESGMLVPVQATGQEITLLQLPKGSNAITINSKMPKGFYYISMAIEL